MQTPPAIPADDLRRCLQEEYGVAPAAIEFLPVGLDAHAGVYRVVSGPGAAHLLKVKSGPLYEASCRVPTYLHEQGVAAVVAPVRTKRGALWTQIGSWTAIVYPFIEGDAGRTGMTGAQWRATGAVFRQIHETTPPPAELLSVRTERFDPAEYVRWVRTFDASHLYSEAGSAAQRALLASWTAHRPLIHAAVASLETLARVLQGRTLPFVICHADLHSSNLLRDGMGRVFVIDWDDVMLAPKECDFIFVGDGPGEAWKQEGPSPFFQGYGETKIDWTAVTYYRWERVVTDLIEYARNVFFRDDLREEDKDDAARGFQEIVRGRRHISAAEAAAARFPHS